MLAVLLFLYAWSALYLSGTGNRYGKIWAFFPLEQIDDISALDQYQVCVDAGFTPEEALKIVSLYSRDNARTPVQWDSSPNAGFTTGIPWLMVNPNYREINVKAQEQDKTLSFPFINK